MTESSFEHEQEDAAAAEAGSIGGQPTSEPPGTDADQLDPAQAPLIEAGEGEAEGFELAEEELIEHASHGDEHAARRVIEDAYPVDDTDRRAASGGEADEEHSSQAGDDQDR
jgi:hypothetical protein